MFPQVLVQVVSLVRNALCVCKSLVAEDHWSRDPIMKAPFFGGEEPEDVLIIEAVIGLLQLMGGVFLCAGAVKKMLEARKEMTVAFSIQEEMDCTRLSWLEYVLLSDSLDKEKAAKKQKYSEGIHELNIGVGFFFLCAWSFHSCSVVYLMLSLSLVEVSLAVLLWYGGKGIYAAWRNSQDVQLAYGRRRRQLPHRVNPGNARWVALKLHREADTRLDLAAARGGRERTAAEVRRVAKAITDIDKLLEDGAGIKWTKDLEDHRVEQLVEADKLVAEAVFTAWIIFLNIIAGVGYFFIPLTYYVPDEGTFAYYLWDLWPGHEFLAWWGTLAGDLAWTLEPLSLLAAPALLALVLRCTRDAAVHAARKDK
mmetsp:Transcript_45443/g.74309  ORF Transcript_45443/g.74309 Transcript_45443/m.74309 type:complete len:367 (+) Transcript_45443:100-1200(+)